MVGASAAMVWLIRGTLLTADGLDVGDFGVCVGVEDLDRHGLLLAALELDRAFERLALFDARPPRGIRPRRPSAPPTSAGFLRSAPPPWRDRSRPRRSRARRTMRGPARQARRICPASSSISLRVDLGSEVSQAASRRCVASSLEDRRPGVERARPAIGAPRTRPPVRARLRSAKGPASCASSSTPARWRRAQLPMRRKAHSRPPGPAPAEAAARPRPAGRSARSARHRGRRCRSPPRERRLRSGGPGRSRRGASRSRRSPRSPRPRSRSAAAGRARRGSAPGRAASPHQAAASKSIDDRQHWDLPHPVEGRGDEEGDAARQRRRQAARSAPAANQAARAPPARTVASKADEQRQPDDPELAQGLQVERVGVAHRSRRRRRAGPPVLEGAGAGSGQRTRGVLVHRGAPQLVAALPGGAAEPRRRHCRDCLRCLNSDQPFEARPGASTASGEDDRNQRHRADCEQALPPRRNASTPAAQPPAGDRDRRLREPGQCSTQPR